MIQHLFDKNIFIYVMAGMCLLGIVIKFIISFIYKSLINASENMGTTGNKLMKMLKLKFEACYKLKIGVNNVDVFVDKYVYKYKFCGVLLYTWENFGGQILILCMLTGTVSAGFGLYNECARRDILSTFFMGILTSSLLIMFESFINLPAKRSVLKANISDYLDNFLKVRLEREYFNPELLEEYRNEYFDILTNTKEEPKDKKQRKALKKELKAEKFSEKKGIEPTLSERQKEELKRESRKASQLDSSNRDTKVNEKIKKTDYIEGREAAKEEKVRPNNKLNEESVSHQLHKEASKNHVNNTYTSQGSNTNRNKNEELEDLINNIIQSAIDNERQQQWNKLSAENHWSGQKNGSNANINKSQVNIDFNNITPDMILEEYEKRRKLMEKEKHANGLSNSFAVTKEDHASRNMNQDLKVNKGDYIKESTVDNKIKEFEDKKVNEDKKTSKIYEMTENEERIIEDILKEFLA